MAKRRRGAGEGHVRTRADGSKEARLYVPVKMRAAYGGQRTVSFYPTTGFRIRGELYMDSNVNLFVCVENGAPGTWKWVQTVAA